MSKIIINILFVTSIVLGVHGGTPTPKKTFIGTYTVTAYCPCKKCCGKYADGITANGHKIKKGEKFCAAPKEIPFNTMLIIKDYHNKPVPAWDRGGAIKGKKLDVFFDTHQEALNWGVKKIDIYKVP